MHISTTNKKRCWHCIILRVVVYPRYRIITANAKLIQAINVNRFLVDEILFYSAGYANAAQRLSITQGSLPLTLLASMLTGHRHPRA